MNIEQVRSLFPITKEVIYLNSASQAPLNTRVYDRLQDHLKTELNPLEKKAFLRENVRVLLSKILLFKNLIFIVFKKRLLQALLSLPTTLIE